jgi:hypothetical protein
LDVILLIIGLSLCSLVAVSIIWATQSRHPQSEDDDFALADKPKHRLNESNTPFDAGVRDMIRAGRSRDAVRIYQEFTGTTLEEAEQEISRLEWEEKQDKDTVQRRSSDS